MSHSCPRATGTGLSRAHRHLGVRGMHARISTSASASRLVGRNPKVVTTRQWGQQCPGPLPADRDWTTMCCGQLFIQDPEEVACTCSTMGPADWPLPSTLVHKPGALCHQWAVTHSHRTPRCGLPWLSQGLRPRPAQGCVNFQPRGGGARSRASSVLCTQAIQEANVGSTVLPTAATLVLSLMALSRLRERACWGRAVPFLRHGCCELSAPLRE